MKKIVLCIGFLSFSLMSIQAQEITKQEQAVMDSVGVSNDQISHVLKGTLKEGVDEGSKDLSQNKLSKKSALGTDIPSDLKQVGTKLSRSGDSDILTAFEDSLNKVIPDLVGQSKPVFDEAINRVDMKNAYEILTGGKNAATEFLENNTRSQIESQLEPLVEKSLISSGTLDKWSAVTTAYNKLTGKNVTTSLPEYLTNEIVDQMFDQIGQEESKIRFNQFFWSTALVRKVMSLQHKMIR